MEAYSMDLRRRVVADSDEGMGTTALAKKYRVSESWIRNLKRWRRESGQIGPRPQRVHHRRSSTLIWSGCKSWCANSPTPRWSSCVSNWASR